MEVQYETAEIDDIYADDFGRRKGFSSKPDLPGFGSQKAGPVLSL